MSRTKSDGKIMRFRRSLDLSPASCVLQTLGGDSLLNLEARREQERNVDDEVSIQIVLNAFSNHFQSFGNRAGLFDQPFGLLTAINKSLFAINKPLFAIKNLIVFQGLFYKHRIKNRTCQHTLRGDDRGVVAR